MSMVSPSNSYLESLKAIFNSQPWRQDEGDFKGFAIDLDAYLADDGTIGANGQEMNSIVDAVERKVTTDPMFRIVARFTLKPGSTFNSLKPQIIERFTNELSYGSLREEFIQTSNELHFFFYTYETQQNSFISGQLIVSAA